MSKQAMKLALEALKELVAQTEARLFAVKHDHVALQNAREAITAIKQARSAPVQEPVAWMVDVDLANYQGQSEYRTILAWNAKPVWSGTHEVNEVLKAVPLYTSPPAAQRQWVGLTPREIYNLWEDSGVPFVDWDSFASIAQAIQAKLKEKNT